MNSYVMETEENIYNAVVGSKYFIKFCRTLGMDQNEMDVLRVFLNNQDEYITHTGEISEYTGLSDQQVKRAIAKLKTRKYIKITTEQVGMQRTRKVDLWDFVEAFSKYIDKNYPAKHDYKKKTMQKKYVSVDDELDKLFAAM